MIDENIKRMAINAYEDRLKACNNRELALQEAVEGIYNYSIFCNNEIDKNELLIFLKGQTSVHMKESVQILVDKKYTPWLINRKKDIDWQYWKRYRTYLVENKKWGINVINDMDDITNKILDRLKDPIKKGESFDIRGLVVGDVQSGKTANYTALINKALDSGYKIIIVLSGMHNNLRCQTQSRLDAEVFGFETSNDRKNVVKGHTIGVGRIYQIQKNKTIIPMTSSGEDGDFNKYTRRNITIHPDISPLFFVTKKNKSPLENILKYFRQFCIGENKRSIIDVPILIIDDEADQASINTKDIYDDDGEIDEEYDATAINRLIRQILNIFSQKAYIGYTATPFANILIHDECEHTEYGEDLFPRSFIINLPKPSNYIGPTEIFGSTIHNKEGQPIIRTVLDKEELIPHSEKRNSTYQPIYLPNSLKEAIKAYILSVSIRRSRGQKKVHNSMLIHATRFNDVQINIAKLVKSEINNIKKILKGDDKKQKVDFIKELKKLWQCDFEKTTLKMQREVDIWESIEVELINTIESIEVKIINGKAKDALDYIENIEGLNVIAIGGDKLSRGLTLEGLTVSYYLRASRMYDTLMQTGRWFGYRVGYEDLCRIYTTSELATWFRHIADATEELRDEFEIMALEGATPKEYGLKIRSHPSMLVTNNAKMRTGKKISLSYSETVNEVTTLDISDETIDHNFNKVEDFIRKLGLSYKRKKNNGPLIWNGISGNKISNFLKEFRTDEKALRVNGELLSSYINKQLKNNELNDWTVVLYSLQNNENGSDIIASHEINLAGRSYRDNINKNTINIGKLLTGNDELIDLTENEKSRLNNLGYSTKAKIRKHKSPNKGLLIIYPIKLTHKNDLTDITKHTYERIEDISQTTIMAFGVVFPGSKKVEEIEYVANNIFMEMDEYDL